MEFDLLYNFAPILSIVLLVLATIATVFYKLKLRWPVKANCWFCNKNTKIWRQQLNWWICPHCEQYNGFSKNGDYTYDIPEQHQISNERKRYCATNQDKTNNKVANNGLCNQCNMNESIKLSKLSAYMPENENNYEYEIKNFKAILEQQYPLCSKCNATVHNLLCKQALWIAQYKMLLFKQKPFTVIANNKKYSEPICRITSTILGSILAYNMDFICLPIGGLFFQFCAYWITPNRKQNYDILLMFLWICMIILLPFKDIKLIEADLLNTWISLEYVTQYHMIILFISVIGSLNIIPKSQRSSSSKNMSFKRVEISPKNTVPPHLCTATLFNKPNFSAATSDNINQTITQRSAQDITRDCKSFCEESSTNSQSTVLQNSVINQESQLLSTHIKDNTGLFSSTPQCKKSITESHFLNDSLNSLSTLSLSEEKPKLMAKTPTIFETKVYSTKNSELFKKFGKRTILSPPKLKSVMQTSWVAGGFWQEGIDVPSLSRSSSQSSGFGSVGSNFGPSREPSIHEFDRCSVMSDVTQSFYTLRQNNSPVGSFYQQSMPVQQTMKLAAPTTSTLQTLLPLQNNRRKTPLFIDQCLHEQNMNLNTVKSSEMHVCPSHTTIVTSPVWLPALLCGSLVLNIIVLCTTLLR